MTALTVAPQAYSALPTTFSVGSVVPTPSGRIWLRFPDGQSPEVTLPLLWSTITPVAVSTGATGSVNLRSTYLTEIGSPAATLSTTCVPALAGGFTTTANGISWTSTTAYSGVCTTSATRVLDVSVSQAYVISATAPPASDATAPTIPTKLSCESGGSNVVPCSWDYAFDPIVSGLAGSGIAGYDLRVNGGSAVSIPASPGLSTTFATTNIGAGTGTHTCTQSGTQWTLVGAGTGTDGTADGMLACSANVTGDFTATMRVSTVTPQLDFSKAGIDIRATNDANSAAFSCYVQCVTGGCLVQSRNRATTGGSRASQASSGLAGSVVLPIDLRVRKDSTGNDCEYSSDRNNFIAIVTNNTIVLPATSKVNLIATRTSPGNAVTAVLENVAVSTSAAATYTHANSSGNPTTYEIRSRDADGNASAYSASVTATPLTSAPASAIKWHPGTYLANNGKIWDANWKATFDADLAAVCANSAVKGFQKTLSWAALEGPTKNDYTAGFANIDYMLGKLQACNKRLIVKFLERNFGAPHTGTPSASSESWLIPTYVMTDPFYGNSSAPYGIVFSPTCAADAANCAWTGGLKTAARFWEPAINDRLIALSQAYGARYNSNINFEMWSSEETSVAVPSSKGYTGAAYITQLKRWLTASSAAFPNTQVRLLANFLAGDMVDLLNYCYALRNCAVGGPDPELPLPSVTRVITGNRVFRGLDGGTDRRGVSAWVGEQQDFGLTERYFQTPLQISTYQMGTMRNNYMVWGRNGEISAVMSYINSSSGAVYSTACPSNYPSCVQ